MMKKLLIVAAVAVCLPAFASESPMRGPELNAGPFDFNLKWNPAKITNLGDMAGTWKTNEVSEYTYTPAGEVATEIHNDGNGKPWSKVEYTYDSADPSLVVKRVVSHWNGTSWNLTETKEIEITRNAAGYITVAEEKEYGYVDRMEVEYGADNCPVKITVTSDYGAPDAETGVYTDLVWNRFDGKSFLIFDDMDDLLDMIPGEYSIKSAKYTELAQNPADQITETLNVTFNETVKGAFSYVYTETEDGEVTETNCQYTPLDEFGSYESIEQEREWNTSNPANVEEHNYNSKVVKDKFGLITYFKDEEDRYLQEGSYTVEYDTVTGYPLSYWDNQYNKYLFDGIDYSGVTGIEADTTAPIEYFTIGGVHVSEPTSGLYIVRQGDKITKMLK